LKGREEHSRERNRDDDTRRRGAGHTARFLILAPRQIRPPATRERQTETRAGGRPISNLAVYQLPRVDKGSFPLSGCRLCLFAKAGAWSRKYQNLQRFLSFRHQENENISHGIGKRRQMRSIQSHGWSVWMGSVWTARSRHICGRRGEKKKDGPVTARAAGAAAASVPNHDGADEPDEELDRPCGPKQ
jgi:hypothetical protein